MAESIVSAIKVRGGRFVKKISPAAVTAEDIEYIMKHQRSDPFMTITQNGNSKVAEKVAPLSVEYWSVVPPGQPMGAVKEPPVGVFCPPVQVLLVT